MTPEEHRERVTRKALELLLWDSKDELRGESSIVIPDEKERNQKSIDMMCIGRKNTYFLEHTKIDAYEGQVYDGIKSKELIPLEKELEGKLPNDGMYFLSLGIDELKKFKKLKKELAILGEWIKQKAPLLNHVPQTHRYDVIFEQPEGLPFKVKLRKGKAFSNRNGSLWISREVNEEDLERRRSCRIARAVECKIPKLLRAKYGSGIVCLVLESNDRSLSNSWLIGNALKQVSSEKDLSQLNYVMLIETEEENKWYASFLKDPKKKTTPGYREFSIII